MKHHRLEYDNYGNILRKKIYRYLPKVSSEDLSSDQLEQSLNRSITQKPAGQIKLTRLNGKKKHMTELEIH